jgi:hypothetical protein
LKPYCIVIVYHGGNEVKSLPADEAQLGMPKRLKMFAMLK